MQHALVNGARRLGTKRNETLSLPHDLHRGTLLNCRVSFFPVCLCIV